MKTSTFFVSLIAFAVLTACKPAADQSATTAPAEVVPADINAPAEQAVTGSPGAGGELLELPVAAEGGTPSLLSAATSLSGTFTSPKEGKISAVGLQIGNYDGSADGTAILKVCLAEACQEATSNITGSADNAYLQFQLDTPIAVSAASALTYTFTRVDGSKPFAIWTYPTSAQNQLTLPDGNKAQREAKVAVTFQ
jgi:hypothetical protein